MDVTKKNFTALLPEIEDAIKRSICIAIDGEFTGLQTGETISPFDLPQERYTKLQKGALDFLMIQFGMCTFFYDSESDKYSHRAYNFYIYPKQITRNAPDKRFLCQASSLQFLSNQGFDFNKVIKDGIPFLLPSEEQKIRVDLEENYQSRLLALQSSQNHQEQQVITIPDEHKEYVEKILNDIEVFITDETKDSLDIICYNPFIRKLVFQEARKRFGEKVYLDSKVSREDQRRYIYVSRVNNTSDKMKLESRTHQESLANLDENVGFSKLARFLSQSNKLILGHNMLLDVLHLLHHFISPLPDDYQDFKELVKTALPQLIDTKLMASTHPFRDRIHNSALGELLKTLTMQPYTLANIVAEDGNCGYNFSQDKAHEAGYDAYITGLCFLSMCDHLSTYTKGQNRTLPGSPLLEPFLNKLYVMRVNDAPYININGIDMSPSRDHVFHVKFPKEWKSSDIVQLFNPFGAVHIHWKSASSADVALVCRSNADLVLRTIGESSTYTVTSLADSKQDKAKTSSLNKRGIDPVVTGLVPPQKKKRLNCAIQPDFSRRSICTIQEEPEEETEKESKLFEEPMTWG